MSREKKYQISLLDILLVLFIVLKLTGNIDWSWWWVLSPLWVALGLGVLAGILGSR